MWLEKGAHVDEKDRRGRTPLYYACNNEEQLKTKAQRDKRRRLAPLLSCPLLAQIIASKYRRRLASLLYCPFLAQSIASKQIGPMGTKRCIHCMTC